LTQIDFYSNAGDRILVACQLAAKAVAQQLRVLVLAPESQLLQSLDRAMWSAPSTSFLPHCVLPHALADETPILLSSDIEPVQTLPHDQVLMNFASEPPAVFSRFSRLVEIVGSDEQNRQQARARFKFYRDRGYEIRHHDLSRRG
jgi:DNA polymerase-3 subunit chi